MSLLEQAVTKLETNPVEPDSKKIEAEKDTTILTLAKEKMELARSSETAERSLKLAGENQKGTGLLRLDY